MVFIQTYMRAELNKRVANETSLSPEWNLSCILFELLPCSVAYTSQYIMVSGLLFPCRSRSHRFGPELP